MAKKRNNIFFSIILAAFFAVFMPISSSYCNEAEQTYKNPNAHDCKRQEGSNIWTCTYKDKTYTWEVFDTKLFGKNYDNNELALGYCKALPARLDQTSTCFFCPLFMVVFNAVQDLATNSFAVFAPYFKIMLSIGFAIWIAFITLPTVASLDKSDAIKYLKTFLSQSFVVGICFLLLLFPKELYRFVIDTVLIAGMDFGSAFLYNVDTSTIDPTYPAAAIKGGLIGKDVYFALDRLLQAIQQELSFLLAMGMSVTCVGFKSLKLLMWFNGAIVTFLSVCLLIAFGFLLIDALIQIGLVGALMPILIATYPFKVTREYSKTAFRVLMNSFFVFLIMGVVISIDVTLITQALLSGNIGGSQDPKEYIFEAFQDNNVDAIAQLFDIGAAGGVGLIACIMLAFKFTQQATSIADQYAGGALVKGISSKTATMGAQTATAGAKKVAKPVAKASWKAAKNSKAGQAVQKAGQKVGEAAAKYSGANWAKEKMQQAGDSISNSISDVGAKAMVKGEELKDKAMNTKAGKIAQKGIEKVDNAAGKARQTIGLDSKQTREKNLEEKLNSTKENDDE